ncbi:MAG TPA: hypothetical protein VMB66_11775 [Candidatus Acidoferrales bacterium]|nr:hypothetical protein [Candidatus Acidoferrales bacterium]
MRGILGVAACALPMIFAAQLSAQTVLLRLTSDVNSKMKTGTPFEARDLTGKIYHGHLVTHRARRMMRNGSMVLVFDEKVKAITKDPEGVFHGGNKVRLLKLGGSLGLAKLADDSVDGTIGASKARYVGAAAAIGFLLFTKGEEARLHAGDTIEVAPGR